MKATLTNCIRLNAPDFFEREDFQDFLNRAVEDNTSPDSVVATFHTGGEPGDMSDIFVTYDHGEGSHAPSPAANTMPEEVWSDICDKMESMGVSSALLWITNLRP